mgnify:FL=1
MKETKKGNGFTLIELLATIIILGILSTAVFVGVNYLLKNSQARYYETLEDMIILAAKDYYSDYHSQLPTETGAMSEVSVEQLVKLKYLDPVYDHKKKLCDVENSLVKVVKEKNNHYAYYVALICDNHKSDEITIKDNTIPDIIFSDTKEGEVGYKTYEEDTTLVKEQKGTTKIIVTMHLKDNDMLDSYYYVVRNDQNNIIKSVKGVIENKQEETLTYTIEEDGSYQIEIQVKDKEGNRKVQVSPTYILDNKAPDCSVTVENRSNLSTNIDFTFDKGKQNTKSTAWQVKNWLTQEPAAYVASKLNNLKASITAFGSNKGYFKSVDTYGNYCEITTKTYKRVPTAPTISESSNGRWINDDIKVTGKTTVSVGVDHWEVKSGNGSWKSLTGTTTTSDTIIAPDSGVIKTDYSYRYCLTKDSTYCSIEKTFPIKIDTVKPTGSLIYTYNYDYLCNGTVVTSDPVIKAFGTSLTTCPSGVGTINDNCFKFSIKYPEIKLHDDGAGIISVSTNFAPTILANATDRTFGDEGYIIDTYSQGVNDYYYDGSKRNKEYTAYIPVSKKFTSSTLFQIDWVFDLQILDGAGNREQFIMASGAQCAVSTDLQVKTYCNKTSQFKHGNTIYADYKAYRDKGCPN